MHRWLGLGTALALAMGLNALQSRFQTSIARDPHGVILSPDSAVETAAFFSLGMRRLAADLGLIRLIIYYGTPDEREAAAEPEDHAGHDHGHEAPASEQGKYQVMSYMAMRVLDLDPSLSYAALFAAGALAFNLNRPSEALEVLEYALKRDPKNVRYQSYIGAVGFHRSGDPDGVIRLLEPALADPDCPTMIKSMMAFLYRRSGHKEKAIRLYRNILESRDRSYDHIARQMLQELESEEAKPAPGRPISPQSSAPTKSQEGFGGFVTARGAAISGAAIVFTSEDGARKYRCKSDESGRYEFALLPAGRYRVEASHPGYRSFSTGSGFFAARPGAFGIGDILLEPLN